MIPVLAVASLTSRLSISHMGLSFMFLGTYPQQPIFLSVPEEAYSFAATHWSLLLGYCSVGTGALTYLNSSCLWAFVLLPRK